MFENNLYIKQPPKYRMQLFWGLIAMVIMVSQQSIAQNLNLPNVVISGDSVFAASTIILGPDLIITENGTASLYTDSVNIKPEMFIVKGGKLFLISGADPPVKLHEEEQIQPGTFALFQNYPNPFNPSTTIIYQTTEKTRVLLEVYTISGKKVKTLINKNQSAGKYSVTYDATGLASGFYIYKLRAGSFEQSRKMLLLK